MPYDYFLFIGIVLFSSIAACVGGFVGALIAEKEKRDRRAAGIPRNIDRPRRWGK